MSRGFEEYLSEKLDRNWGKEKLYQRVQVIVQENKPHGHLTIFQKNLWAAYLSLLEDKEIMSSLGLPVKEVKEYKSRFSKKYQATLLDHLRDENGEPTEEYRNEVDEQENMMENVQERHKSFSMENSYKRSGLFRSDKEGEDSYEKKIKQCNVESFLFNRLYEMMITIMIQEFVHKDFNEYTVKAYKTSSYDDLLSGVDVIVALQDNNGTWLNVGIDHICGNSKLSIDGKERKGDRAYCMEYNTSIRNGNVRPIPRVVWNTNPGISFLLFDWYLSQIVDGKEVDNKKLFDVYYEIQQSHPELYKESVETGTGISESNGRIKDAILDLINN